MGRPLEDVRRVPYLGHPACIQDDDPFGDLGRNAKIMCDQQERTAALVT
jgi:hypothetical protein